MNIRIRATEASLLWKYIWFGVYFRVFSNLVDRILSNKNGFKS